MTPKTATARRPSMNGRYGCDTGMLSTWGCSATRSRCREARQQLQIVGAVGAQRVSLFDVRPAARAESCAQLGRGDEFLQGSLPLIRASCVKAVDPVEHGFGVGAHWRGDAGKARS